MPLRIDETLSVYAHFTSVGIHVLQDWLTESARLISKSGHTVEWLTPLGLPVIQPYRRTRHQVVSLILRVLKIIGIYLSAGSFVWTYLTVCHITLQIFFTQCLTRLSKFSRGVQLHCPHDSIQLQFTSLRCDSIRFCDASRCISMHFILNFLYYYTWLFHQLTQMVR